LVSGSVDEPQIHRTADQRKVPIPGNAAQAEADDLLNEAFGEEIEEAKTAEQRQVLIATLLAYAAQPDTPSADRYALLKAALDIAPDATTAMTIIDEMVKYYQIDELSAKEYTIKKISKSARTVAEHQSLANAAASLMDHAVRMDKYEDALRMGSIALASARETHDSKLLASIRTKTADTNQKKIAFNAFSTALATLEKDPSNAEANLIVGKYKCFTKAEWASGLRNLAICSDATLKELAANDLGEPSLNSEQAALGDAWWNLAEQWKGPAKAQLRQRAAYWYRLSLDSKPRLSTLIRIKVEKRLAKIPEPVEVPTEQPPTEQPPLEQPPPEQPPPEQAPPGQIASGSAPFGIRSPLQRELRAKQGGGNETSEQAVEAALIWLASHQNQNGSWSWGHTPGDNCSGFDGPGTAKSKMGATGMALLPFLGAGYTHQDGKYQAVVRKGLLYLVGHMVVKNDMGKLFENNGEAHEHMYCHGIAACALVEAYGMTQDRKLKAPAQLAIDYIVAAQHPENGGWRYQPGQGGDTSVFGWQVMALKSAALSNIQIPGHVNNLANRWLDLAQYNVPPGSRIGSHYGYRKPADQATNSSPSTACSAIGLLCRIYLGAKQDDLGLQAGVKAVAQQGPGSSIYFNYYGGMVMYQADGPNGQLWQVWNLKMRDHLVQAQVKSGKDKGSWLLEMDYGNKGGRLYNTAMSAMTLEVYYRYPQVYVK
jgi:hypothetical protein